MTDLDFNKLREFCDKEYQRANDAMSVKAKPFIPTKTVKSNKPKMR